MCVCVFSRDFWWFFVLPTEWWILYSCLFMEKKILFTGYFDVPLTRKGVDKAIKAGKRISNILIDVIHTSTLTHVQMTSMLAMTQHRQQGSLLVLWVLFVAGVEFRIVWLLVSLCMQPSWFVEAFDKFLYGSHRCVFSCKVSESLMGNILMLIKILARIRR